MEGSFFVLFFKPCLSTCFCLFKYSYCFYLILSHLTYKRKQIRMQTEIIISLMYSLILRETLLCWLWMPWLRNSTLQNRHTLSALMWVWFICGGECVCVNVCILEGQRKSLRNNRGKKQQKKIICAYTCEIYFGSFKICQSSSLIFEFLF